MASDVSSWQSQRKIWSLWLPLLFLTVLNLRVYFQIINFSVIPSYTMKSIEKSDLQQNESFSSILKHNGRFDNSRRYLIHDFTFIGDKWAELSKNQTICLATQTSVEHLFRLVELSQSWQGLISVAVFVPGDEYHVALLYVQFLRRCFASVAHNVSIHFAYPFAQPPRMTSLLIDWSTACDLWKTSLKDLRSNILKEIQDTKSKLRYPQNHLRNVARKGCQAPFVFLVDVDIIPRFSLAQQLHQFLQRSICKLCAFVVPTYEVDELNPNLPTNKSALLKLVQQNQSQPFHKTVFPPNQRSSNLYKWERLPEGKQISIGYPVTNLELYYEPFYVAHDTAPPHDERFVGYGFTRNTQVYEMQVAGYKFWVLNYAFALHRGFNRKKKFIPWREKQNNINLNLLGTFKKEIYARYNYFKKS